MASMIRSTLEAVGLISKEVREAVSDDTVRKGHCVECDGVVTHPDAYFCEECAPEFFNHPQLGQVFPSKCPECGNVDRLTERETEGIVHCQKCYFNYKFEEVKK